VAYLYITHIIQSYANYPKINRLILIMYRYYIPKLVITVINCWMKYIKKNTQKPVIVIILFITKQISFQMA